MMSRSLFVLRFLELPLLHFYLQQIDHLGLSFIGFLFDITALLGPVRVLLALQEFQRVLFVSVTYELLLLQNMLLLHFRGFESHLNLQMQILVACSL